MESEIIQRADRRKRRGANAIEFALVLPVFTFLMLGIMEFSWFFFVRSTVVNAVRDGCRAGAVIPPSDDYESEAVAVMENILATWNTDCSASDINCTITVTASGSSPEEHLDCSLAVESPALMGIVPLPTTTVASATVHFELQR